MKDFDSEDGTMKKILKENPIKVYARKMLREGSIDEAESSLAAKDISDRVQDMVEEVSKMLNDELPKLVDKIRGTFGQEQASAYQQAASGVLSELLSTVSEKKAALEQAVLVLTGDAQAQLGPKTELGLPDEDGEDVTGDEATDFAPEGEEKIPSPLGRAPRLPAEESRKFNKALSEAKIVALKKALDETNTKKFPIRARRLAEELRRVATIAIKEAAKESKAKKFGVPKDEINVEKTSKTMLKRVAEAKKVGKKPEFLVKAEKKAEGKKCIDCKKNAPWGKSASCEKCLNKKDQLRLKDNKKPQPKNK